MSDRLVDIEADEKIEAKNRERERKRLYNVARLKIPGIKERIRFLAKERSKLPEVREKSRIAAKKWFEKPGNKEKRREKARLSYLNPERQKTARMNTKRINSNPNRRFKIYQWSAINRGHQFSLTFDNFMTFWKKPCTYGGCEIETIGLDRVDSSIGYTLENTVSCCAIHNKTKNNLSKECFIEACRKVAAVADLFQKRTIDVEMVNISEIEQPYNG